MDIGTTKMSSRGQVVIPIELRKSFGIGEKLVVLNVKGKLILKKLSEMGKNFLEDLEFARRTNKALEDYEQGKGHFTTMDSDEFLSEIKKDRIAKQIGKISDDPEVGKPMSFGRRGTREVYVSPFRLSYLYSFPEDKIIFLDLYHKDEQ